jgi:hypothetical protein
MKLTLIQLGTAAAVRTTTESVAPVRKRITCQTCENKGCTGHCRFK